MKAIFLVPTLSSAAVFLASIFLVACSSSPSLAPGSGQGLVTVSQVPPTGVQSYGRPEWKQGDRFIFRKAGELRLATRVVEVTEAGYRWQNEANGMITAYDADLGQMSEENPEDPESLRVLDPADTHFAWPLWVGKQWTCHYLDKRVDAPALPYIVTYECEAMESIKVPAGTFDCLRICRRVRPATKGRFTNWTSLSWYSPEVGYIVRKLDGGHELELMEYQRQ